MKLAERVAAASGQPILLCYQCRKCTAGCPTALEMDLPPHEVVRRVLLGEDGAALGSAAIWLCVGCGACGERCPNGIAVGQVMPVLRQIARDLGVAPGDVRTAAFHAASAESVRAMGRLHEAALLLDYARRAFLSRAGLATLRKLARSRQERDSLRSDVVVGLQLVAKRKLPIKPASAGRLGLGSLFDRCAGRR